MELWGSEANRKVFISKLDRFASHRKFENMTVHHLMEGIAINSCKYIKVGKGNASMFEKKKGLVTKFFVWLMNGYFVSLLKNAFRITEAALEGNKLCYIRNSAWDEAEDAAVREMSWTPMTEDEAKDFVSTGASFGYAPMRFVPKTRYEYMIT